MATENTQANDEILSDEEIEARQQAEDLEREGGTTTQGEEGDDATQTEEEKAAAQAAADAEAAKAKTTDADDTDPAKAAAAKAGAAGEEGKEAAGSKPDGILSKDGTRVLPFSALQAERRAHRAAAGKAATLEEELAEAKKLIEDLKAGKTTVDGEAITEADVKQMEEDFPEKGKQLRKLFERANNAEREAADAKASAKAKASAGAEDPLADNPIQDAIDGIPLLLDWQMNDKEKFARAVEHDDVLKKSPKWVGKTYDERFAEATRRTADEYDIEFEKPKAPSPKAGDKPAAKPQPTAAEAAAAAKRKPPESLSEFKGGSSAEHGQINPNAAPHVLLKHFESMTSDEQDAWLERHGDT